MMRSNILILAYAGLVSALPNADCNIKSLEAGFSAENIITRDVLVVGGGSGGTYTATRLQQEGKSVAVVEKELILGGMTNTYTVPGTDITIDYGVIVFHNISLVRDYFSYYNIALAPSDLGENSTDYNINFVTGEVVNGPAPNETLAIEALDAYLVQLDKYPYLTTGFNLPDPVPEDLLIPFKDFVTKYNLAPMVPFSQLGGGQADLLEQATLYAFKILGPDLARSVTAGLITTAAHDNSALYEAAAAKFDATSSLFLSSTIVSVNRNCDGKNTTVAVIETPSGKKLIKTEKIVVAIPLAPNNFAGWDLDSAEKDVFSAFEDEGYWTALINGTGLPEGTAINNVGVGTPFDIPIYPGITSIRETAEPGLFNVMYTSPYAMTNKEIKTQILDSLRRLNIPGVTATPQDVEWVAFKSHIPFFQHVTIEEIKNGFYKQAMALEGHRNTWYTGATWQAPDSSMIWNFTETILPAIIG